MDKRIANNLIVGVFVLVGLGAFVYLTFSVGNGGGFFARSVSLYGKFAHVKGLHAGSEVSLSGLRVGVVESIEVASDGSKDLVVQFSVNRSTMKFVRLDSVAKIRTQGMLGDKYIEISIGSNEEEELKPGSFIQTGSDTDLFSKSGDLVEQIKKEFKDGGNIQSLIANLNEVAKNIATITKDIKNEKGLLNEMVYGKSGPKLAQSLTHLENIFAKIEKGEGTLGALIKDPTVYEDLKYLFGGAKRSTVLKYFIRKTIESTEEGPDK